ncbi:MAG: UbiA family prenyltransferase [Methanomicrobiales archaeon]|nr:UbiA family prenyltransferase [Methanomicrobiales archaeon]
MGEVERRDPQVNPAGQAGILRAYLDLTRAHFAPVWPILFLSGLVLASTRYDGLTWILAGKAALIGLLGFEGGIVLNDYIDRKIDVRDIDPRLTRYWRPFGTRPLAGGVIPPGNALALFAVLALSAGALIATLPFPHSLYVGLIMVYSYGMETFYQLMKRRQRLPVAQLLGRTDLALFPVAGYLALGHPDELALLIFLFLYPWAEAHLGVNDLADLVNDRVRGMKTVPVLLGVQGNIAWIAIFSLIHAGTAFDLHISLGPIAWAGCGAGLLLLLFANLRIAKEGTPESALRSLPLFHASLLIYAVSLILDSVI